MNTDPEKRIKALRLEIQRLRKEYHESNNPGVTDDVYESLSRELGDLLNEHPEFKEDSDISGLDRVAGKPLDKFVKVTHSSRMLSLNDAFSFEDVLDWDKRIKKLIEGKEVTYFAEVKLDGLAVSLIYENGAFIRGATRGDGFIGEDITENLKMIKSVPLILPPLRRGGAEGGGVEGVPAVFEVRGEVVMKKNVWEKLNKEQLKGGKQPFANTRNAAAGSVRQLDPQIAKERNLDFFAYDLIPPDKGARGFAVSSHSQKHALLRELGFTVEPHETKSDTLEDIFKFITKFGKERERLAFGTDGIVICVDDLSLQEELGVVGKAPRYATAFKYPAERATTVVKDITVNIGRTGVLTPLAHFTPTLVAGSTVSKATLHNMDQIERLDIRVGDTVVIQKAGDVIPEVVEVLVNMRTGKEKKFKMPTVCPACNSDVFKKDIFYYCENKNCKGKDRRGMQHFVNAFEIYEIGPKILDRLKDEGLITDAADLFTLEKADLAGLERFGEKSADNIITSVNSHKKVELWRFIYALGILHVGEQTARDIAEHFGSLNKIMTASSEKINEIENIGPVVSMSLYEFFQDKKNQDFVNKLLKNGVAPFQKKIESKKLSGKIFVLTGTLPTLSRDDAKKKILASGGKVSSSVSKATSYVLAGESAGSKLADANKLGVPVLTEDQFLKML